MKTEYQDGTEGADIEVGTMGEMLEGSTALEAVDRASIDMQIATAKKYPRSVDRCLKEAVTLATLDEETAASMFYSLPRSGKTIEGPSARLAEVMAYSWGNLRVDADIVAEDRTHVTAMGTCFDLEKNVAVRVRVKRRITDSKGRRYNEDMIGVTSNAAISIALRNSVFKVIPAALVRRIYGQARTASLGKGGTMAQKRQQAMEWYAKAGVKAEEVFALLEVRGMDDLTEEHLIQLRGLATAIKDGETTIEQVFRSKSGDGEGANELNDALKKNGAGDEPEPATDAQKDQLKDLREKARAADLLTMEDEESITSALRQKTDGTPVREWNRELNVRLAKSAGGEADDEQGSLV